MKTRTTTTTKTHDRRQANAERATLGRPAYAGWFVNYKFHVRKYEGTRWWGVYADMDGLVYYTRSRKEAIRLINDGKLDYLLPDPIFTWRVHYSLCGRDHDIDVQTGTSNQARRAVTDMVPGAVVTDATKISE